MADPRQTLQDLIRRFGTSLAGEPQRCKGMLMDLCGSSRREISGLVMAIEEKITTELMKHHPIVVSLRANMILRLVNNRGLDHDLAVWTVDTWGLVLGTWTQADLDSFSPIPPQRQAVTTPPVTQQRTETVIDLAGVVVEPPQLDRSQELPLTATERQTGTKKTVVLDNGKRLEVTIPDGMNIGQKILLSGHGEQDPVTGALGDLYLVVQERSELSELIENPFLKEIESPILTKSQRAELCAILAQGKGYLDVFGECGMGKTTILKSLGRIDVENVEGLGLFTSLVCIYLDCKTKVISQNPDEFWNVIFEELGRKSLNINDLEKCERSNKGLESIMRSLAGQSKSLLLILDEFDGLIPIKTTDLQQTRNFLTELRGLTNHDPSAILVIGTRCGLEKLWEPFTNPGDASEFPNNPTRLALLGLRG